MTVFFVVIALIHTLLLSLIAGTLVTLSRGRSK